MAQKSDIKIIANGHVIEVYRYEKPTISGYRGNGGRTKEASQRAEEHRKNSSKATRNRVRRQVLANFDERSKFITLTYRDNVTDLEVTNRDFKRFIQKLRYKYKQFKYLAVIEFQERGAVHYHMISDLPYIENSKLAEIWGHGFVKINDIRHVDNVGAYMCKYMLKNVQDERLKGNKAYLSSRGLDKEIVYRGDDAQRVLKALEIDKKKKVFANSYESEHNGLIEYEEYNMKRKE